MKLTKDYIINHIRQTKYPCWSLFVVQNYKRIPLYFYNGEDFEDGDTAESKAEKAVARLTAVISEYPADALLSIDLKSSKGANGSQGTIGPLEFYNREKGDTETPQPSQQGFAGFGFPQPPAGWVSEEVLNGKLEAIEAKNTAKINEILFQHKQETFRDHCRQERKELEELRKELNDEKKKYESHTGAAAETLVLALKRILGELFPQLSFAAQPAQPQLSGAEATQHEEPRPTNPKYTAVEALANALYQDGNLTETDINEISLAISQRSRMKAQQAATTVQPPEPGEEDGYNV